MTYIVHNPDGTIKTFMDTIADLPLAPGETVEQSNLSFEDYAALFVLSHNGQECQTVYVHVGDAPVLIDVSVPGVETVSVDVNDQAQFVSLTNGRGSLTITTETPGAFTLAPSDRRTYSKAGSGSLIVIVQAV
jgi:hypothetical protein